MGVSTCQGAGKGRRKISAGSERGTLNLYQRGCL